jgi:uncharacterized protein with HEPN domain
MSFDPREFLRHMLAEAEYLARASAGVTRDQYDADETLQRAVTRSLEIIGEAATRVGPEFRAQHPAIEWRAMTGMRNRLVHEYFGVDQDLVWEVLQSKIPDLQKHLRRILDAA